MAGSVIPDHSSSRECTSGWSFNSARIAGTAGTLSIMVASSVVKGRGKYVCCVQISKWTRELLSLKTHSADD